MLIRQMQASVEYWLRAAYRNNEPEIAKLAQDRTPADLLQGAVHRMAAQWQRRFNEFSLKEATRFAKSAQGYADKRFQKALKDAGFTIEFHPTPAINDALQAAINENVALIKSIPSQYFTEIEGMVMRAVQRGGDLEHLTTELRKRYGITRRRAETIARDQNAKATAVVHRVRQQEIGVTEAVWMHSHGGRHPRQSHLEADGKRFEVAKGMYIDGEWIWPGEKINCRCVSASVIPGLS